MSSAPVSRDESYRIPIQMCQAVLVARLHEHLHQPEPCGRADPIRTQCSGGSHTPGFWVRPVRPRTGGGTVAIRVLLWRHDPCGPSPAPSRLRGLTTVFAHS